jgi:putative ABC transport system permease protein
MRGLLLRSMRGRRFRTGLATAGVATCTLLVIVIAATYRSVRKAVSDYAGQPGVDLWIAPRGVDNLIRGSFVAFVPLDRLDAIREIPGVAAADPIQEAFLPIQPAGSRNPGRRLTLLTIGYSLPRGLGGPPVYAEGRAPETAGEVALDRAAAFRLRLRVGDPIEVSGFEAVIVGLTKGTDILGSQFIFADFDAIAESSNAPGKAAFVLVRLTEESVRAAVARTIEARFPELRAYTRDEFVRANEREVTAGFVPLLTLSTLLALGAAMLLVGLLVLSVVDDRRADIAVLMALGTGTMAVGRGILGRAAMISLKGAGLGILLALGLRVFLEANVPTIPLRILVSDVFVIASLFVVTGMGAAVAPVVRLGAIDPLEAFRS